MKHLINNYWAVEVPEGATGFEIDNLLSPGDIVYYTEDPSIYNFRKIALPPGTWEIVCTSKDATEDQCAIIAGLSFQDIVHGYSRTFFHDLLAFKGCDIKQSYLILKKVA